MVNEKSEGLINVLTILPQINLKCYYNLIKVPQATTSFDHRGGQGYIQREAARDSSRRRWGTPRTHNSVLPLGAGTVVWSEDSVVNT